MLSEVYGAANSTSKRGKNAIKWTRLSCRTFAANAVRLQLHVLAYNIGNFMRTLAMPKTTEMWSLTSLREKLIKIGAKVVSHGRYVTFQMAEVRGIAADVPRNPVADRSAAHTARAGITSAAVRCGHETMVEMRPDAGKAPRCDGAARPTAGYGALPDPQHAICVAQDARRVDPPFATNRNPVNVG